MSDHLLERVREMLDRARRDLPDPAAREMLDEAARRLSEPLRVAIAGKVKAGKSTLLNALVGEELAPTDAGECTRVVTWYRDGPAYRVMMHLVDGPPEQRPFNRVSGVIQVQLGRPVEDVSHLEIEVPSRRLREHTLIDTPGIASVTTEVSMRTVVFLEADDERAARADAVIYLLRHMHGTDLRFLEAFHGDDLVHGTPVNAVGVLSRADEIGSCRLDAMETAARVAARYQADERLRRLCPVIVPVAGLLGAAGVTLREDEYRSLAVIAGAPRPDVVAVLLTADRFVAPSAGVPVDEAARRRLLSRLGLFGVRLGVQLIRDGEVTSTEDLARALTARSGLDRLSDVLAAQFTGRSRVLKARSALAALDVVLRGRRTPEAAALAAEVEQIRAGAHEFVEVRLLHLLRSGRLPGRPEQLSEMHRLLGGDGDDAPTRLGLPADAAPERLLDTAGQAMARWRGIAEHPLSSREMRTCAGAVIRSCEGVFAAVQAPAQG